MNDIEIYDGLCDNYASNIKNYYLNVVLLFKKIQECLISCDRKGKYERFKNIY